MKDEQVRIADDLAGLIEGELRCDPLTVAMYATDGSLYQQAPLGVLFPRHADDVVTVARYCAEMHIPLAARGAGTGVAGESLGRGLIVDFSRHMRRIEAVESDTIRVQPGIVLERLNRVLRPFERYFPPDPAGAAVTTVGSMLALDASGSHAVRVGSTRDHVAALDVVLAGGLQISAGRELLAPPVVDELQGTAPAEYAISDLAKRDLVGRLAHLIRDNTALIDVRQPAGLRNRCGYQLRGVLSRDHLHLARLLVGSEGTLGLFTSAVLHTAPLPVHRGATLFMFGDLDSASRAVHSIALLEPHACDLFDRRLLALARETDLRFAAVIPPSAEAALLVEFGGYGERQVRERMRMALASLKELSGITVLAHDCHTADEIDWLWSLPQTVLPLITRLPGPTRPLPFVEDIAIPLAGLQEFLVRAQNIFKKHQITVSLYAHAALGQLQYRPFMLVPPPGGGHQLEEIARDLYEAVFAIGGTISGQHGVGLARTSFVRQQYGELYGVFQQIKQIFDPHNLMNPGKIISDDANLHVQDLRPQAPASDLVDLQLRWNEAEVAAAAGRCNGCGACRTQTPGLRMCPLFRLEPVEEASPRAKANLMRNYLAGQLHADDFTSPEMRRVADLCFNCKQCQLECPAEVDIPHLMIEAKAAYVAAHGLRGADWILSRIDSLGRLGGMFPRVTNRLLSSPAARVLLETLTGIARQRKLPPFARRTFMAYARRERLTRPVNPESGVRSVVYFVDHYVNYHDPQLGRALVEVLRHHGIAVYVPEGQTSSGMALIAAGDLEPARARAERNLRVLGEYAREGVPILCTEPTAALCLQQEYPLLLDHPDARAVADQTIEAGAYLQRLHAAGKLRSDFQPLDLQAGYHTPCHLKALGAGAPFAELLDLIPQLRLTRIEQGCSGMAGAYGLTRDNYRNSVRIGWGLISRMRRSDLTVGTTECSSCKLQMEQGTTVPTLHPLKLLALAYGVLPEVAHNLKPSTRKLLVT